MRPQLLRADEARDLLFMVGRLTRSDARLVELIGSVPGEGVSTLAADLAIHAAILTTRPVLLLDLGQPPNLQLERFAKGGMPRTATKGEAVPLPQQLGGNAIEVVGLQGSDHLFISRRLKDGEATGVPQISGDQFATWLRARYEWVIVDAPSVARSFDGVVAAGFVDAVVMVVAAETTRAPVVERLRDRLVDANANIAGVIFNRRKFYIPRFLYRRL